jgi:hypothetical protein
LAVAAAAAAAGCESPPEKLSAPGTLYVGFRKAKLKKSWREHGSSSLRTKTLRVMLMQFLDGAAIVFLQVWAPTL